MKCDATKAMEDARAGLISKHPSLGYLCFKLNWFPDSTCPTAWTDGVSVGFNPEFVMSLNKAGRQFLAAHEVAHPMFGHHLRRNDRNPKKWNIACDHVVNLILSGQGFKMIEDAVMDWKFSGMAVEQVYNILFPPGQENEDQDEDQDSTESGQNDDSSPSDDQKASEDQKGHKDGSEDEGGGSDDSGDAQGDPSTDEGSGSGGQDQGSDDGKDHKPGSGSGKPGKEEGPGEGEDDGLDQEGGSGSSGDKPDHEAEPGSSGKDDAPVDYGPGEVRDFPSDSAEDNEMEAEKWDLAVQQAAQMERRLSPEGDLPGFVETMITNISDPKLPWTEILSRWLTSKARSDYSWTRPNPRYSSTGFFLPALESFDLGKVALFWDTSCSVTDDQVEDIGAETHGILVHFPGVLIDLYHIDTKVQHIEEINEYTDWDSITARGRGGTDFRPGFYAIEDSQEEAPVGVIYMTDGECSKFPEEAPPYPVLWIVVDMPHNIRFEPPFGEVAYYNDF